MPTVNSLDELAELVADRPPVYLRYCAGPEADDGHVSRDYESGLALPGLPTVGLEPPEWWTRPLWDWLARQTCKYAHLSERDSDRYAWLLNGREVGRGPDYEPLIADPRPLAVLGEGAIRQARHRYHDRFEVGRAS